MPKRPAPPPPHPPPHAEAPEALGDEPVNPVDGWYTAKQAAAIMEVSLSKVYVMADAGVIRCENDTNNCKRFEPESVQAQAPTGVVAEVQKNQTEVLRVAQQTIALLLTQQKAYLDLVPDAVAKIQTQQQALIDKQAAIVVAMHEENQQLRKERAEMIVAYEHSLSQAHERETQRELARRRADLWDRAWADLTRLGPSLVEQVLLGADVQKLLGSIDPDLLEVLTADGSPLPEDQRVWLKSIKDRLVAQRAKKANGAGDPATAASSPSKPPEEQPS